MTSKAVDSTAHAFGFQEPQTFLAVFSGRARTADVVAMKESLAKAAAQHPGSKLVVFTVVANGATIGERGRKAITEMMLTSGPFSDAWAIVIEGEGLWAMSARAITTVIMLAARHSFPVQIHSNVDAAWQWLRGLGAVSAKPPVERLAALRASMAAPGKTSQQAHDVVTVAFGQRLTVASLDAALAGLAPRIAAQQSFSLLVDATVLTGYDADARDSFSKWTRTHRQLVAAVAVVTRNPMYRMVVSAMAVATDQRMAAFAELNEAHAWLSTRAAK